MSLKYMLSVDYQAVVRHLLAHHPLPFDPATDEETRTVPEEFEPLVTPYRNAHFLHFRDVLDEHVTHLMSGQPFNEDSELTEILFKDYRRLPHGIVSSAQVTDCPGTVVREEGETYVLPLVFIEVQF